MEPVTHVLTGACLSRAGLNRRAAYATLTMAIAAEMPDIDTVWSWLGPVEGFAHHRGITHTFVAVPVEAAVLVAAIYGLHRWRRGRARKARVGTNYSSKPLTEAPVRWWMLYVCALVGLLSHLFLDYMNDYGVRPFYPFNPRWYAASLAFIFDPVIFLLLAFALVLPPVFGLVSAEVGEKANPFRGRGLAIAALLCICAWLGVRAVAHQRAIEFGMQQTYDLEQLPVDVAVPQRVSKASSNVVATDATDPTEPAAAETELVQPRAEFLQAQHVLASPNPLDPLRWALTLDFGSLYQLANVDARTGSVTLSDVTYPKLPVDTAIRAAEESPLGRVYLDWSSMPIITEDAPIMGNAGTLTRKVLLRDPRFMGDISWLRLTQTTPLSAAVTVEDGGHVLRESMDGRREPSGRGPVYEAHLSLPRMDFSSRPETEPVPKATPDPTPPPAPVRHIALLPQLDPPVNGTTQAQPPSSLAPKSAPVSATLPVGPPLLPKTEITKAIAPPVITPVTVPPVAKLGAPGVETSLQASAPKPSAPLSGTTAAKSESAEQGAFGRGYKSAKARAVRIQNWLHWLANGG